ncbi:ribosomal-protein-alanine N-acetyltransferase [Butyricicoccus sp. 1XD8-22]|nr:ribosomal-protein-alanine N-acetyltransferase [Butyricicoccus sp. 1XD8-22]
MKIVAMEECHIAGISEVERQCFREPWSPDALREELGRGIFLAAVEGGTVAGYAGCQTVLDEGYITNVAVLPAFRRQGIAGALIAELLRRAEGLSFVTLEVRASNAAAIALYEKYGFEPVGTRRGFYRQPVEDALLMTRRLR